MRVWIIIVMMLEGSLWSAQFNQKARKNRLTIQQCHDAWSSKRFTGFAKRRTLLHCVCLATSQSSQLDSKALTTENSLATSIVASLVTMHQIDIAQRDEYGITALEYARGIRVVKHAKRQLARHNFNQSVINILTTAEQNRHCCIL